ncbi:MAG: hypothetical protein WHS65_13555 [Melioribacteraceae bacterium]
MDESILLLSFSAAFIGFVHTVLGPDHYLPFVAIAHAHKWTIQKTLLITSLCGICHILSSVFLGFIGIIFGVALNQLELVNSVRGEIASWLLISFGLIYFLWGLKKAWSNKNHLHIHNQIHEHNNLTDGDNQEKKNLTTWVLFIIFIFGPCESLIPLLLYPTVQKNIYAILIITIIFMITTVGTMIFIVVSMYYGTQFIKLKSLEKYSHAIAGLVILISGMAIEFLGL